MLRLIGAVLLLLAAVWFSGALAGREHRRAEEIAACLDLVRFVRARIDSFCSPRAEIFLLYRQPLLEDSGFLAALRRTGQIASALDAAPILDAETASLMIRFDAELGRGCIGEALAGCDFYAARLTDRLREVREGIPNRIRVRRTAVLSGALLAVILLL